MIIISWVLCHRQHQQKHPQHAEIISTPTPLSVYRSHYCQKQHETGKTQERRRMRKKSSSSSSNASRQFRLVMYDTIVPFDTQFIHPSSSQTDTPNISRVRSTTLIRFVWHGRLIRDHDISRERSRPPQRGKPPKRVKLPPLTTRAAKAAAGNPSIGCIIGGECSHAREGGNGSRLESFDSRE